MKYSKKALNNLLNEFNKDPDKVITEIKEEYYKHIDRTE